MELGIVANASHGLSIQVECLSKEKQEVKKGGKHSLKSDSKEVIVTNMAPIMIAATVSRKVIKKVKSAQDGDIARKRPILKEMKEKKYFSSL